MLDFLKKSPPGGAPPPAKVEEIRLLHLGKLLEDTKNLKGMWVALLFRDLSIMCGLHLQLLSVKVLTVASANLRRNFFNHVSEYNFSTGPDNVTTVHISCRVPSNALEDVKDKLNKKSGTCCALM